MANPFATHNTNGYQGNTALNSANSTKSAGGGSGWFQSFTGTQKQRQPDQFNPANAGPGDQYRGWLKHSNFGDQERQLLITVLRVSANQAGGPFASQPNGYNSAGKNVEPQIMAKLQGVGDIGKAFGQDGLKSLVGQVDQDGHLTGNVMMKDTTGRFLRGTFMLNRYRGPTKPNAPDPSDLALSRFGSEKRDFLRNDEAWRKWATQKGIPFKETVQAQPEDLSWHELPNNWFQIVQQVQHDHTTICNDYTGVPRIERRLVEPKWDGKLANSLFNATDGKLGVQWDPNQVQEVEVVDLFCDKSWGSPNRLTQESWWIPGNPETDDTTTVFKWRRLYDDDVGAPYQPPMYVNRNYSGHMCGKIYQGALKDFYIVMALQMISTKSKLVEDMFMNCDYCEPARGFFQLRFYKQGQWVEVLIDGELPYDKADQPMCCRHEDFPGVSWPSLVEKAYAKLHGTWMALSEPAGDVEEVLIDLTGGCAGRFSTSDVAADRMWKYFTFIKQSTIWGCMINDGECAKRNIPIAKHWAAAIFDVTTRTVVNNGRQESQPVVGVFTSAPLSSVRHFPLVDMGNQWDYHLGYMWLRIDDFVQLFSDVYECRLVNTDFGFAEELLRQPVPRPLSGAGAHVPPLRPSPQVWNYKKTYDQGIGPLYENIFHYKGDADMESSPSFLMDIPSDTELIMDIGQQCSRYFAGKKTEVYRSDVDHGIFSVTYKQYIGYMEANYLTVQGENGAPRRRTRGELSDLWEKLPVVRNPTLKPGETQDNRAYVVREPQAPLLLRFYECSKDMEYLIKSAPPHVMPDAESRHGELHLVHMSAWAHTRNAMCCVKVRRGGTYMASVTMPSQYSCQRMCFRTYSNQIIQTANFQWPRNLIITNPGAPSGAFAYSLTGLPRIDGPSDALPRMHDDDGGEGLPHAGPEWVQELKQKIKKYEPDSMKAKMEGGPQITGHF